MFKQLSGLTIGLIVIITLILIGVNLVFSYSYFEYNNINTASLDLLNNTVTAIELRKVNVVGYFLASNEIKHLEDVAELIIASRIALLILIPVSAFLLFKWKSIRNAAIVFSWILTLLMATSIKFAHAIGGTKLISGFLHKIAFPQGNWTFNSTSVIRKIYSAHVIEHGAIFVMGFTVAGLATLTILVLWLNKRNSDDAY